MDRNCERPRAPAPSTFVPAGRAAESGRNFAEGQVPNFESRLATVGSNRWNSTPENSRNNRGGCGGRMNQANFLHMASVTPPVVPEPFARRQDAQSRMPRRTNQNEDMRDGQGQHAACGSCLEVPRTELRRASSDPGLSEEEINKCHICRNKYSTKGSLTRHMKNIHQAGEKEQIQRSKSSINLLSRIVLEVPRQDDQLYEENIRLRYKLEELEQKYARLYNAYNALAL